MEKNQPTRDEYAVESERKDLTIEKDSPVHIARRADARTALFTVCCT
jgi:hypothetical protein